jgi:hypothetical protein
MTYGLTVDALQARAEYGPYFMKYLEFIKSKVLEGIAATEQEGMETPPSTLRGSSDSYLKVIAHALIESFLEKWSSRRCLCTTIEGHLACVPRGAQKGDLISVLYNGKVPHVLRPQKLGYYIVVGDCLVDGLIHGEALSGENSRSKPLGYYGGS